MRCEDVRPLLPELAEGELREAGPVEAHLASCATCPAELDRYRAMLSSLGSMRYELIEPPRGFQDRMLALAPTSRWRILTRRLASDERVQLAAVSVGGLLVGAAAIGLLRRRSSRKVAVFDAVADAG
jgi:anti-sigma factor RsiW